MSIPNTITIPLNPEGALELGMCPCDACHIGWANYGEHGLIKSCHENCGFYKKWDEIWGKQP